MWIISNEREPIQDGRHEHRKYLVPTRWSYSSYCKGDYGHAMEHFPNRVISCFGDVPWPPTTPDLSPLDFFLWGI